MLVEASIRGKPAIQAMPQDCTLASKRIYCMDSSGCACTGSSGWDSGAQPCNRAAILALRRCGGWGVGVRDETPIYDRLGRWLSLCGACKFVEPGGAGYAEGQSHSAMPRFLFPVSGADCPLYAILPAPLMRMHM